MRTLRRAAAGVAVIAAAAVLAGCAGRYGSARWDAGVAQAVEAGQVLPGHRYYTWGSENMPDTILGLQEARPLRTLHWREVAMTPALLGRLAGNMKGARVEGPYGRVVLDDRGERIGIWYSYLQPTTVKLLDDGGLDIPPPLDFNDGPGWPRVWGR